MNVAILLTGHIRTYQKTYNSFFQYIINPNLKHNIDIFIDTWDTYDGNISNAFLLDGNDSVSFYVKREDIEEKYKPKILNIDKWDDIKDNFLADKYFPKDILDYLVQTSNNFLLLKEKNNGNSSSIPRLSIKDGYSIYAPQFYKFYNGNQLRKKYEKEKNVKYDFIIRTRPDILFLKPFIFPEDTSLFYSYMIPYWDIFFATCDKYMDTYCNLYNNMEKIVTNHKTHPFGFESPYHMYSGEFFEEWNMLDGGISYDIRRIIPEGLCQVCR